MRTKLVLYSLIILTSCFLLSCGEDNICPPPDATITMSPDSISISDSHLTPTIHTEYFTIYVADAQERPISGAKISIYYVWAIPDVYGDIQLYDGTTPVDAPFNAETNEFGYYYLRVDFQSGGLEYSGSIEVRSCSVYGDAEFAVETGG